MTMPTGFRQDVRAALTLTLAMTLLTGICYPMAMTAAAQFMFPKQANGSLVRAQGRVVGSALIGQPFNGAHYLWSRPSATGSSAYNATASSGSNLGPTNTALHEAVTTRVLALRTTGAEGNIPIDLVTASASGLDPHISPHAALIQAPRIAATRGRSAADIRAVIVQHIESPYLGFWGETVVNVLAVNLA